MRSERREDFKVHFMPGITNLGHLVRETLDGMCRYEPRGLDGVLVPQFQKPINAYGGTEDAARDVGWVGMVPVNGVDPLYSLSSACPC